MYDHYSDEELWAGVQSGNDSMFKTLYHRYVLQLSNQAFRLLLNEEYTKDLVQEAFLHLYTQRNKLPSDINVGAYLTISVKNKSFNLLRNIKSKQHHHRQIKEFLEDKKTASPFEISELRMQLTTSLAALKGKYKKVFFLRHYENKSPKEIGAALGISEKTVEKHVSKALHVLKEKMGTEWIK